jgi:hypothetical protein
MTAPRWLKLPAAAAAVFILLAAAFRLGLGRTGATGPQPSVTTPPPSAALLRRLAESADAYRTGDTVYLVASDTFPYRVVGGFPSANLADTIAKQSGMHYHVYPAATPPDSMGFEMVILPGCYKNNVTTMWICPKIPARPPRLSDVEEIEVTYRLRVGDPIVVRLQPDSVGALIFTIDAFDRFMVPYYTRLFGPAYVQRLRENLLAYAATSRPSPR